jgi:hypothetical protein
MNDQARRTQWAEHLRDEAGAIAQQQVSAGTTHGPVDGPLPHSLDHTATVAQDAVLAEREDCAALAASFAAEAKLLRVLHGATPEQLQAAAALALHIAGVIRAGADRRG